MLSKWQGALEHPFWSVLGTFYKLFPLLFITVPCVPTLFNAHIVLTVGMTLYILTIYIYDNPVK